METGTEQHVYSFDVEKHRKNLTVCQDTQRLMLPLSLRFHDRKVKDFGLLIHRKTTTQISKVRIKSISSRK